MELTLDYMNVDPQYTADELAEISRTTPSLIGQELSAAKISAANGGFTTRVVGSGDKVISQVPTAGEVIPENGVIVLYTETDMDAQKVQVPDFTGLSVSQVNRLANESGINVVFSGPTDRAGITAYKQSVKAEGYVDAGTRITVYFREEDIAVD